MFVETPRMRNSARARRARATAAALKPPVELPPELPIGQILPGDCVAAMRALPDASVDLVFADPPRCKRLAAIDGLRAKGLEPVSLDRLLRTPVAGKRYYARG